MKNYFKLIQNHLNLVFNSNYECIIMNYFDTAQKMKFSIKDFFCKCDQIRSFLRIWSKRVTFCAVQFPTLIIYLVVRIIKRVKAESVSAKCFVKKMVFFKNSHLQKQLPRKIYDERIFLMTMSTAHTYFEIIPDWSHILRNFFSH